MKRLRLREAFGLEVAEQSTVSTEEADSAFKGYVVANLAAIHAGTTKNDTVYGADKLKGNEEEGTGVASWTNPYNKPVLTHHDTHSDPIGRVLEANYMSGNKPFIKLKVKVTDEDSAKKVLDGRYDTVSIGAETDSATCTICGTDIVKEGFCGHLKGKTYEGETCRWILGELWFNEVSYVNVPADQDAGTLSKELVNESVGEEMIEKLGDGTAVLIVVPDEEDKPLSTNESFQEPVDDKKHRQKGATDVPEDKKLKELEDEVKNLKDENSQLADDKADLEKKLQEAETKRDEYKESIDTLKSEKKGLEEEKDKLLNDANEKAEALHEALAERIVDMRIVLGKPVKEEREDEVKKYAERSFDSLNDSMSDLVLEYKDALPTLRDQIESATNPGAAVHDGTEPNTETEGVNDDEEDGIDPDEIEEKTVAALKGLFNGGRK